MSDILKPDNCPFCGDEVTVEEGVVDLEICCCVSMYMQISDCMTIEERQERNHNGDYYADKYIQRAKEIITKRWNARHQDEALRKSHAELVSHLQCLRGFVMMRHKRYELSEAGFISEWDKIGKFLMELPEEQALSEAEKLSNGEIK